jgi:hypothetical protein
MANFNTPIEEILFRSSKVGLLASGLIRHGLTENQKQELERLELLKITPIGLTENQAKQLKKWDAKIADKKNLSTTQMEKRDDYRMRLTKCKGLTPNQEATLQKLIEQNNRPPELSDGAKTYIKEVWLENEKGFREEISSKYLRKGLQAEEDALNLISFVDKQMYLKNKKRVKKGHLTGECDIKHYNKEIQARIIDDAKCCWNPRTFMNAKFTTLYEWQGRAYMYLYDAEIFRLRYCLVDCPPDVYIDEKDRSYFKFKKEHGIIDDTLEEYQEAIINFEKQFDANSLYENSGRYTKEERIKTFMIERDPDLEETLLLSIKLGIEYYKTIKLNMK